MKKLTLSAERQTVDQAKKLAAENNTSVSSMFARFVRLMTERRRPTRSIGPIARKASGMICLPKGETDRRVLEDSLLAKYGLKP